MPYRPKYESDYDRVMDWNTRLSPASAEFHATGVKPCGHLDMLGSTCLCDVLNRTPEEKVEKSIEWIQEKKETFTPPTSQP